MITIAASEFHYTPEYILSMPYFLLVRMIEERNIMNNSHKNKKNKDKILNEKDLEEIKGIEIKRG